jgi:hypothetical protein
VSNKSIHDWPFQAYSDVPKDSADFLIRRVETDTLKFSSDAPTAPASEEIKILNLRPSSIHSEKLFRGSPPK